MTGTRPIATRMTSIADSGLVGLHLRSVLREGARRIEELERENQDLLDQLDQERRLP